MTNNLSDKGYCKEHFALNDDQIQTFLQDGVLVVENVLTKAELETALAGLSKTLERNGVVVKPTNDNLMDENSGRALAQLSSTNGSGGVLDIFYEDWKMNVASNPRLFSLTTQLWEAFFCHGGETKEELDESDAFRWHPYGPFDCQKGYMYIDRIGYRLPTKIADEVGSFVNSHKKKRMQSLQRSLTPHLDCCPDKLFESAAKWRPIQCFVSLTDNLEPNTGGFEAAKGFHRTFDEWTRTRPHTTIVPKAQGKKLGEVSFPPPCVGEYTHMRPKEDREVMDRVRHIPVQAGSAVFWDNRIAHSNAYRHIGEVPRSVVYSSFLPDIPLNREYVRQQLANLKVQRPPTDQWIEIDDESTDKEATQSCLVDYQFTDLGRKLIGMEPWR
jgi:hypothetical protein